MSYILTGIIFVIIFSILILIHEFGHFYMAKRAGIKVEEFGLGLPPRIWGKKKGETVYSINAIPFGGFVRMLGENAYDEKALKNKRSFAAASKFNRTKVVLAGVFMNFVLAWLLLTFTLSVGMEPLLLPNEFLPAVENLTIESEIGVNVKSVSADFDIDLREGDKIVKINLKNLEDVDFAENLSNLGVLRDGEFIDIEIEGYEVAEFFNLENVVFDNSTLLPYLKINNLGYEGDVYLYSVDDRRVFTGDSLLGVLDSAENKNFTIYSLDSASFEQLSFADISALLSAENTETEGVLIEAVMEDSPAMDVGILSGDLLKEIDGLKIETVDDLYAALEAKDFVSLTVLRDGEILRFDIELEESKLGVYLSEFFEYEQLDGLLLSQGYLLSSVDIKDVKYPVYKAVYMSVFEGYKLSKATAVMFVDFLKGFVLSFDVPQGVSGPVGIAQMTHTFAADGFIALLRFMAILSLSLGVLNLLPIPALDGGRFLFILIEAITGRRVNQKLEAYIHMIGYIFVLLLIVVITFNDIKNLF